MNSSAHIIISWFFEVFSAEAEALATTAVSKYLTSSRQLAFISCQSNPQQKYILGCVYCKSSLIIAVTLKKVLETRPLAQCAIKKMEDNLQLCICVTILGSSID